MRRDQLNRRVHQTSAAAKAERHRSPQVIQRGRAVRQNRDGLLYIAYCKTDAPDTDEIICYPRADLLDWDNTKNYAADDWVEVSGTEYKSLQNNNQGHAVSNGAWWEEGTLSVTVKCLIVNGSSLMYAAPFLHDGDPIMVGQISVDGTLAWYCTNIEFNGARFSP